jgi:AcrR family transcriptional regulator
MAQPRWTRRAEARPDELAAAALELCSERGVQATRVADVAAKAGVTVGTVYRYFRGKDELIAAAMQRASQPVRRASVPDRPGASIPAIADGLRRWGGYFSGSGRRALRVALSDPARYDSQDDDPVHEAARELTSIIEKGITQGEIRSDLDAQAVAHALVGALVMGPVVGGARDDGAEVEALVAIALRGLRPDGPSWRA